MAFTIAEMVARVSADNTDFNRGMTQAEGRMNQARGKIGHYAGLAGVAVAAGLAAGAVGAVKSAVNLNEQINKTNVVFAGSEKQVLAWSKTLTQSFGLSSRAALESAGTMGNMLVPMGIARSEAAKMSMQMTELAGDMASFNNATPEEALDALRSGLAGETEPLRRLGVDLRVAALEEYRMAEGIKTAVSEMTGAQKATLIYQKIIADTSDQQGDFARTSDSLANQERILKAEFENTAATLGQQLIPIATKLAGVLGSLITFTQEHTTATKIIVGVVAGFATGLIALSLSIKIATLASVLFGHSMRAWPIFAVISGLILLGTGLVLLWKKSETFRKIVTGAWDLVRKHWNLLLIAIFPLGGLLVLLWRKSETFRNIVSKVFDVVRERVNRVRETIARLRDFFVNTLQPAVLRTWQFFADKVQNVVDKVRAVINAVRDMIGAIKGIPGKIGGIFSGIAGAIGGFGNKLGTVGPASLDGITALANRAGLVMTSGYRPGDPGWHGQNRARDYSGPPGAMLSFARMMAAVFGGKLLELIHSPLGFGIKNGQRVSNSFWGADVIRDHFDHVHVAMGRGGIVPGPVGMPVPILAHAGETVLPTHKRGWGNTYHFNFPNYVGSKNDLMSFIRNAAAELERRSGRPAF
jgi:hypothetical protein